VIAAHPSTRARHLALAAVCTLLFLTFLDNTIVSVALVDIQGSVHAGVQSLQWIVNGYVLVFACMMLTAGALGDQIGHRKVMLAGATIFCAGSIVCALATNSAVLIAGRAIMGLGAAGSEPGTLTMLRHLYPEQRERAHATGIWAAVSGLALALGPVIGGAIIGFTSWRGIFWFNLFFGAGALALAVVLVPETVPGRGRRLDLVGTVLGAGSLGLLVFGIIDGETAGYTSPLILAMTVVAVAMGIAFVRRERHAPFPVLDMRFASAPTFAASNLVAFATYFGTFAIFFFCALYLRAVVGDSGYLIALEFVPMMVAMIVTSLTTGRLLARTGIRTPIVAGCTCFAAGLVLTGRALGPHPAYLPLAGALALAGAGIGLAMVPTTFAATDAVPLDHAGMASSAINTSREIGAVAGTAVLGAIVNATLVRHLTSQVKPLGIEPKAVIDSVRRGGLRLRESAGSPAAHLFATFENKVLHAVYDAFYSALQICLVLSASVVMFSGAVAFVALRNQHAKPPPAQE